MRRGMIVVGIDPGLRGGVCVLGPDPLAVPMPVTGGQIDGRELAVLLSGASMVAIEHAQAMPRQGVTSTFRYGTGFGILLGVCEAIGVPYRLVRPQASGKSVVIGAGRRRY
jgi:crossover junction endodeoxyribonuclease RuvC